MKKIYCDSFTEIIQNYIKHKQLSNLDNHSLISHDEPKDLSIGFSCCDEQYLLRISVLRKKEYKLKDQEYNKILEEKILSRAGRIELANIITRYVKNSLKDLDRYLKLKAFW